MRNNWNVVFLLSFALLVGHATSQLARIHRGNDTDIASYPHQVSIRIGSFHMCGGSIIDARHILTAAHCVVDTSYVPFKGLRVHAGTSSIAGKGQVYEVADRTTHPGYQLDDELITAVNDVGILKLATPIKFDKYMQPIALPTRAPKNEAKGTIIGWGRTEKGAPASTLQKLDVTVLTVKSCQPLLLSKIYDTQVCAQHGDGRGACHGDSGGPLVVDGVIVGIASWVERDICASEWPDVYTNVYAFLDFIRAFVNKKQ